MRGGVCGAAAAAAAWRPRCREGEREAPGWLTGTVSKAARRGTGQRERERERVAVARRRLYSGVFSVCAIIKIRNFFCVTEKVW
jgi:hypothetical protein